MTLSPGQLEQLEQLRQAMHRQAALLEHIAPGDESRSMAQIAYEACSAAAFPGEPFTPWGKLQASVQEGWHAAVNAVQLETVRATQRAYGAAPG
jgi:hypothetical protein